uniref:transcription initiation factor TFIID subunit 7 isoform X2 n=1 Tax=Myxine glutinosa TaxID=7769 RepID=UPI00358E7E8C
MHEEYAESVRRMLHSGVMNLKDRLNIEFHPDGRHGTVRVDGVPLSARLVDLPCIVESLKTIDKKTFYKTADICQMLICSADGDLCPPEEEVDEGGQSGAVARRKEKEREKKFLFNHGLTPSLKNVRKRRFRKAAKKKYIECPDVEKEVKRLLRTDAEAVAVRWEIVVDDDGKEGEGRGSLGSIEAAGSAPGGPGSGHLRRGAAERDELREIFNELSSSEDEDEEDDYEGPLEEGELRSSAVSSAPLGTSGKTATRTAGGTGAARPRGADDDDEDEDEEEDDDVNVMDAEERTEGGAHGVEEERAQLVLELHAQTDSLSSRLRETKERRRRQEDLVAKVENLALKNRLQANLDDIFHQEEKEQQQLEALQTQLDVLASR